MNESLHCKIRTQDGREVTIRPITPDDAAIERDFIENLSPVSRHYRFMGGVGRPTGRMIHYFTHVDYSRNCALIGTVDAGGMEKEIAVGRYYTLEDGKTCEFAIVVDDTWQRRGIGGLILRMLIDDAREKGRTRFEGYVLNSNRPMRLFMEKLGFRLTPSSREPGLAVASLELSRASSSAPSARQ